jgi:zinc protease
VIRVPVLLLGLASGYLPPQAVPAPGDTGTVLYEVSGVRVIQRVRSDQPIVAVRLYLLGGTRQVSAKTAGIEAVLLRAAEYDAGETLARTGSQSMDEFDPDWTVTGFVGLSGDLDSAWAGFARRIIGPALSSAGLSDEAVDRARQELRSAARRRYSEPDLRVQAIARLAMFPGHPYQIDPEGTDESIYNARRPLLERYARDQMVTSRMLLVVVGDVQRARLDSLVTRTLGRLPRGDYHWSLPAPVAVRRTAWLAEQRALPTNYILGFFTGPDVSQPDYYAFRVATELLSAVLRQRIRSVGSLSYDVGAPFMDWAIPMGGVYASTADPAQVYSLMRHEIEDLRGATMYGVTLYRFLDQFVLDQLVRDLTAEGQAEALGRAQIYFGDFREADRYLSRVQAVKAVEVGRAAKKYMQNMQFVFLGDTTRMHGKW